MVNPSAQLLSLATAVPPNVLLQRDVAAASASHSAPAIRTSPGWRRCSRAPASSPAAPCGPIEWFAEPRGWPERTAVYLEGAQELFVAAATAALDAAGLKGSEVDAVVTVSSTGIATPAWRRGCSGAWGSAPT
jgi:alkylresorcinol/alkylpyrone synthase